MKIAYLSNAVVSFKTAHSMEVMVSMGNGILK